MRRALSAALRGPRGVNPQVGAVILSPEGEVLAEGWHRGVGTAHAEVDAMSQLTPDQLRGATAVVTLEPCNHTGRTGPCAQALIDAGVARVVYAVDDPGAVSGGGAERLAASGVTVEEGLLRDEGTALLDTWLTVQRLGRPHVTVKWAQSLDGRAAAADGTSMWITGPEARADVHRRRSDADAIVVGIGTVLADDPALTARGAAGQPLSQQPLPVVLGRRAIPDAAQVRRHPRTLIQRPGTDLTVVLDELRDLGIQRVFVEGGPTVAASFLRAGLVDEVLAYVAPVLIGSGPDGDRPAVTDIGVTTLADAHRLELTALERLGDDVLLVARPRATAQTSDSPSPETTVADASSV
ncbi:MAG: bifunctional diaminohydroxyphosphoribosylaminopyrimidine deaminase/5-amino-6-(5-phosphoribosylamino)uracil reductase RibD [Microbacterium sp.]|uniref:bifunctional diaminohydroxyphosphoribosylaminopyrimidine deaminase/5-amino-6-(5-phosphoribosylamino)uracil reductase RibD n=1 Tax=unclassified Microbacterium TaxID=2609290 RepID=UPI0025FADF59|nr:bifunctional diaminohydroxyphosphoribosylaminopyrimidine deaminase/5-amino-6-(5-phosphoribosylamino)uracil reductase RibD [Microbacterium sp. UBA837]